MGDAQSAHVSGKTTLLERISEDIGSGNEGDMLDMQCTVNQDPSVAPMPLLMNKDAPSNAEELELRQTQESVSLTEEGGSDSLKREELTSSQRKRKTAGENSEEDEIELMFKLME